MREILQVPNHRMLREKSAPVQNIQESRELIAEIKRQLTDGGLYGIAAVQLGVPLCIIGVKKGHDTRDLKQEPIIIINPAVVHHSEKKTWRVEQCLSIEYGEKKYEVHRYKTVRVKGVDELGNPVSYRGRDRFGALLQHEIDHTLGIMIDQIGGKVWKL